MTEEGKQLRETRHHLRNLVNSVRGYLIYMDSVMKGPSNAERGKAIAKAANSLDMSAQIASRYGLNKGRRTAKPEATRNEAGK